MSSYPPLRISVPASTANLGPGFDIWGIALDLRNEFVCTRAARNDGSLRLSFQTGDAKTVPVSSLPKKTDADNLFIKTYNYLIKKAGQTPLSYDVNIVVNVPFSRGLGSSSTAILAGLTLANETLRREYQLAYRIEQILEFALEFEPHPDNLTAALYGGWNLCLPKITALIGETAGSSKDKKGTVPSNTAVPQSPLEDGPSFMRLPMKVRAPIQIAGVIPDLKLETRDSRQLIPVTVSRSDLIFQTSRVAALVALLNEEKLSAAHKTAFRTAMEDRMHTSQRAHLIPEMFQIFEDWYTEGALGCFLSGAGSTLLAFWPSSIDVSQLDLAKRFTAKKIQATQRAFQLDSHGLMLLS
ncbi:MAG TPA: homoserine kinase [Turneriella sp.]|nr:homoserine kinase [Turneriella sp.]